MGSEVSHRFESSCCTLEGGHHDAELPMHLLPLCRASASAVGPGVGIGQAWEGGDRAGARRPEYVTSRRKGGRVMQRPEKGGSSLQPGTNISIPSIVQNTSLLPPEVGALAAKRKVSSSAQVTLAHCPSPGAPYPALFLGSQAELSPSHPPFQPTLAQGQPHL